MSKGLFTRFLSLTLLLSLASGGVDVRAWSRPTVEPLSAVAPPAADPGLPPGLVDIGGAGADRWSAVQTARLAPIPDWTAESDQDGAEFGHSVATAGDVNGDGYSDVIVGASRYDSGLGSEGRAFVYHGSASGLAAAPAWTATIDQNHAFFGSSVATAGDVNGDGYADVIVGAFGYANGQLEEGAAFVYHGSAAGLAAEPAWSVEGDQAEAYLGGSVATAGDVNGDGYDDVLVAASGYDNDPTGVGRVLVYHGSASGLAATPAWTAASEQDLALFGSCVATAGDVNGDGYADVIVGARGYTNGEWGEGAAFVYYGSTTGLEASPAWAAEGDQASAWFGNSVATAGDVNGDGYSDVIVGAELYDNAQDNEGRVFVYYGSGTGPSATPDWMAESDQEWAVFGFSVATAGDLNGDGYADVIVGAEGYDNGQAEEGRAFVYYGSAAGLDASPAWTAESDQIAAFFGEVAAAGDVNGDGYTDVIVGAQRYDDGEADEGAAFVYHGAAAGLAADPAWMVGGDEEGASLGSSVAPAGDVNGDGYGDVIVGAHLYDWTDEGRAFVYHGSAAGLTPAWTASGVQGNAFFGGSVASAGDVNGDGYDDVIVGASGYGTDPMDSGAAFVYYGSAAGLDTSPAWIVEGDQAGGRFGYSVAAAGDVNGDGFGDVIVGAYAYDNDLEDAGRAFVYHGSAAGLGTAPAWAAGSDQAGAWFGVSVAAAGDVNGDGYSDVIIGAPVCNSGQTGGGCVFVYHGSPVGLAATPAWTAASDQDGASFGLSVASAGDVNGDGYADVIVGGETYENGQPLEGRAFVYHGSAAGLEATPAWTAEGDLAEAYFGGSVASVGDVNGDGYADVIVGANRYSDNAPDEGRAFVYHGSPAGLSVVPAWWAEIDQANAWFGGSVASAGDVNGDGYGDAIVGANGYTSGPTDGGAAFVYHGNRDDGLPMLPRQRRTDGPAPIARLGRSDSATAFQLGVIGRMPLGREHVRLQWQVAPVAMPITATGVLSGAGGWTDVLTTGVVLDEQVTGLVPGTPYHWRVRLLYRPGNPLGQPAGRWIQIPWGGWNETDLRTPRQVFMYLPLIRR